MADLLSLPLELRYEVYSYLLIKGNVSHKRDPLLELDPEQRKLPIPQYSTSLFCVCKQISRETLDFFYTRNAFSKLTLELSGYLHLFCRADVKHHGSGRNYRREVIALRPTSVIALVHDNERFPLTGSMLYYPFMEPDTSSQTFIVALADLPFFIHCMNFCCQETEDDMYNMDNFCIQLQVNTHSLIFQSRPSALRKIEECIGMFRATQFKPPTDNHPYLLTNPTLTFDGCRPPTLTILGLEAPRQSQVPSFSISEILRFAMRLVRQALGFFKRGWYRDAIEKLRGVHLVIGNIVVGPPGIVDEISNERVWWLTIRVELLLSTCYSKLGKINGAMACLCLAANMAQIAFCSRVNQIAAPQDCPVYARLIAKEGAFDQPIACANKLCEKHIMVWENSEHCDEPRCLQLIQACVEDVKQDYTVLHPEYNPDERISSDQIFADTLDDFAGA